MLSLWLTHAKYRTILKVSAAFPPSLSVTCVLMAGKPRAMDSLYVITVLHRMPLITFTRKMHIFAAFNLASFGQTPITSWVRSLLRGFKLVWSFHVFPPAKLSHVKMILQPWIKPADDCSILQSHWKHDKTWESWWKLTPSIPLGMLQIGCSAWIELLAVVAAFAAPNCRPLPPADRKRCPLSGGPSAF